MGELQTHRGGCHCGKVRYEAQLDLSRAIACNCSICSKKGLLWTFVPPDRFKLAAGQEELRDYQFNRHVIHHHFCASCGTESFARGIRPDGKAMVAVNVRCLDDIDLSTLPTVPFDGKSL
jgi:hypothetical protein